MEGRKSSRWSRAMRETKKEKKENTPNTEGGLRAMMEMSRE